VGELIPMLFDILTGGLFVGGCLLLWLTLRQRGRDVLIIPKSLTEEEIANPKPESCLENSASREPHEAAHATSSDQSDGDVTKDIGDQNSYATRVALAMKNARNQR
jgi:hypothetical protein